jgi:hypothetical protein
MVRHLRMHRQKALGLPHRLESAYGPFSRTRGLVRVLRPVIQPPPTMMRNAGHEFLLRRCVAGKLIGHDGTRHIPMTLEEPAEEALRGFGISALLHQNVEHFSALIDRAPKIHQLAVDLAEHLVEVPLPPGRPRWRRSRRAYSAPKRRHHSRIASYETSTPRSSIISWISRKLRLKRKYNHTQWAIMSRGKQ